MAGQFLEPDVLKDDTQSISSSMNDSAYMSQPDMSHLQNPVVNMQYQSTREQSQPAVEGFIHPDMISPTLSSASHGAFYGQHGDMNAFVLPSSRGAGQGNMMASFAHASAHQSFLDGADLSSPFTSQADGHQLWSHDAHDLFSPAMLASTNSLLRPQLNRQVSRPHNAPMSLTPGFSKAGEREKLPPQSSPARSHMRNINFRSASTPMISNAGLNIGMGIDHRPDSARRASSTTVHNLHGDLSMAASPSASVASHFGHYGGQADAFSYIDYEGGDDSLDQPTTPILASSSLSETPTETQSRSKTRAVRPVEDAAARSDPLYQRLPGPDDLYHCPFVDEGEDCGHKPTKLKCNYDKYIDSHLKPFRCKHNTCIDVQFSSTACLLRHEREAHGMHGHGSKPNLCLYPDCERSQPGNGFPRRYNLYDHMRRVHDYNGPTTSPEGMGMPEPLSATVPAKKERKRRVSEVDASPAPPTARMEKKVKLHRASTGGMLPPPQAHASSSPSSAALAPPAGTSSSMITTSPSMSMLSKRERDMSQRLQAQWEERRTRLQLRLETVGPMDLGALQAMSEDVVQLQRIARELSGLG